MTKGFRREKAQFFNRETYEAREKSNPLELRFPFRVFSVFSGLNPSVSA